MTEPLLSTSDSDTLGLLRPTERVQRFLEAELLRASSSTEGRLPTIKEVSQRLGVGLSTVQTVFARFSREERLVTIPGKGTYVNRQTAATTPSGHCIVTVSIHEQALTGKESTWGKEICAGILREMICGEKKMMMRPFFVDMEEDAAGRLEAEVNSSSAAIIFPSPLNRKLVAAFQAQRKPTIFITPPHLMTTENFVGPNFYRAALRLAECWKATGRKHIALLMHHPLIGKTTCIYSLAGFEAELGKTPREARDIRFSHFVVEPPDMNQLDRLLPALFDGPNPPDAIHSTGDHLAYHTVEWLLKHGISIPETVSVTGGTGFHPRHDAPMPCSVIQQPFEKVGQETVRMVARALTSGNHSQAGLFLDTAFRIGATTRAVENRFLLETGRAV
ncbi:MAG TPA: substrate-binding domain-containing protein [Chthoniobacteraceae bacterium]|nr:substrate-binding domain-containing protein [Chthoniobacteraceae bacterium]